MSARAIATGVSVVAGVVGGIAINLLTSNWSWSWGSALIVTTVVMICSQIWLSRPTRGPGVAAIGTGAVSAGRTIKSGLDIEVDNPSAGMPTPTASDGVQAVGNGTVAAGRDIKGQIRIRSRRK